MSFYKLSRQERIDLVSSVYNELLNDISSGKLNKLKTYFADEDTYIRKSAYQAIGKIYFSEEKLKEKIIRVLESFLEAQDPRIRQTVINAAGEIGKKEFNAVKHIFDRGLIDAHHSPRNAVIGSIKKMGESNPGPVLTWAKQYLTHPDQEVRREICHGIELRGRKYPQDILPLLKKLQFDKSKRVTDTLIHVLGQIAYKKDCLKTVIEHLKTWENKDLVEKALEEIIDVHARYKDFAHLTQDQARQCIYSEFS